ncbi:MAG TPA: hypothetical protein VFG10_03655 [Saprospiraceae bacterium]|nr:hypothetical protein [Saprospiraceae bacterium]
MKKLLLLSICGMFIISCGQKMTFEDQIMNDIKTKIPSGICKEFPKGTILSNIKIGEIVDIGLNGMTDVSYEFDYEINNEKKHKVSALLYIKTGNTYALGSMGPECDFEYKH